MLAQLELFHLLLSQSAFIFLEKREISSPRGIQIGNNKIQIDTLLYLKPSEVLFLRER